MSMRLVIVFEYLGLEIGRKKMGNCSPNSTGRTESKLREVEVEAEREREGVKQGGWRSKDGEATLVVDNMNFAA